MAIIAPHAIQQQILPLACLVVGLDWASEAGISLGNFEVWLGLGGEAARVQHVRGCGCEKGKMARQKAGVGSGGEKLA